MGFQSEFSHEDSSCNALCNWGQRKVLCDKDFAELSGELSGAIGLETLVLMVMTGTFSNCSENYLVLFVRFFGFGVLFWLLTNGIFELFRKLFGAVRAIFWLWGSFLAPD